MIPNEAPRSAADKTRAIAEGLKEIEKAHGKGAILKLGDRVGVTIPNVPSGILGLDTEVLGVGGFPRGRVIEIFGPESGGKTTIALQVIAAAQKQGGFCAFVDAENSFDPNWASKNGVNVNDLLVSQPDWGEQALEIAETLVRTQAIDVIVVDSVAALVPKAELEGEMGDSHMGLQARLMSQALRKLTAIVNKSQTCLIFINQIREKIGVMYGSNETTTGGRALRFYSSVRLDVRRIMQVKDGDVVVGNRIKIKAVKNKCAAPFRETEVELLFEIGIDKEGHLFDKAVELGVVEKSGAWYAYKGERLGQGRLNAIGAVRSVPALLDKIAKEVLKNADIPKE
jgi:recombination protein RecA